MNIEKPICSGMVCLSFGLLGLQFPLILHDHAHHSLELGRVTVIHPQFAGLAGATLAAHPGAGATGRYSA